MSAEKFPLNIRHALWQKHSKRCAYCTESITLSEVEIDHVLPESLRNDPSLPAHLERYGLPADFSLSSLGNLLPAHSHCNRKKSSRILDESHLRHFLGIANAASSGVRELADASQRWESRDKFLVEVIEAFRLGAITPMDIQEPQLPYSLRLSKPIVFADKPDELVQSIGFVEVDGLLDRPVLMGGDPKFAADFGDLKGVRMTVRTCREYRAALAANFHAQTTYDIKSESFLKSVNAILNAVSSVRLPTISYIRHPHRGVADLDLLPASILPYLSLHGAAEATAQLRGLTLRDLLRRGEMKILEINSRELLFEWHSTGLMIRELCRADFDSDGVEDILCECYRWAPQGTLGFGWTSVLSRLGPDDMFSSMRL